MNGLFDLDPIFNESTSDDDWLNLEVNMEDAEFTNKNSATNPTMDIDKDATGAHDINIPIPGGLKETPSSRPKDEHSISIPGGLSETPTAKPKDASSISVPSGTTLSSSAYNDALTRLQKSYKESIETLELMKQIPVVEESYDGMFIEAFDGEAKSDVKRIVKELKSKITGKDFPDSSSWGTYSGWKNFLSVVKTFITHPKMAGKTVKQNWTSFKAYEKALTYNSFQIVGTVADTKSVKDSIAKLNDKFTNDLEGYKILGFEMKLKYDSETVYVTTVYVDKKNTNILSTNLSTASKEVQKAISGEAKDVKTESKSCDDEECDGKDCKGKKCKGKDCKDKDCEEKEECVKESYELDIDDLLV